LGVLDARALYGKDSVIAEAALDLVIDLGVRAEPSAEERLSGRRGIFSLLDQPIPEISLPRRVGHNLAVLVEAACRTTSCAWPATAPTRCWWNASCGAWNPTMTSPDLPTLTALRRCA